MYWCFQFLFTLMVHLHVYSLVSSYSCLTEFSIVANYDIQGDQKVSVHLTLTVQKTHKNIVF
jgi:hypothetical protein